MSTGLKTQGWNKRLMEGRGRRPRSSDGGEERGEGGGRGRDKGEFDPV